MEVTTKHACHNIKVHRGVQTVLDGPGPRGLAEALVLALRVPAAGALALLLLLGTQLFPVGLAVLVDQSDLGRERGGDEGRLRVGARLPGLGLLVLVLRGESQDDVPVQDAQRHAGHGVFEVVLGGEAVVEAGV